MSEFDIVAQPGGLPARPKQSAEKPHAFGARPTARPKLTPQVAREIEGTTAAKPTPPLLNLAGDQTEWGMLGNQHQGDCVLAAFGHLLEVWSKYTTAHEVVIAENDVLQAYKDLSGWDGNPNDEGPGLQISTGANFMINTGFSGLKIFRSDLLPRTPSNDQQGSVLTAQKVRDYISAYGGVVIMFVVPQNLPYTGAPWTGALGPETGDSHCVPLIGYDQTWFECITWGYVQKMNWDFLTTYCSEVWLVGGQSWIAASGETPSGLNRDQLNQDIAYDSSGAWA